MISTALNQELFEAAVAAMPVGPLSSVRRHAAELFVASGFPTTGSEDWKYTNLSAAADISNDWFHRYSAGRESTPKSQDRNNAQSAVTRHIDATWLVFHNGVVDPASMHSMSLQPGVSVSRLSDDAELPMIAVDTPLSAFNAALLDDGIRVRVGRNVVVEKPLGILLTGDTSRHVSQIRLVIEAAENSTLRVIECAESTASADQYTNSVVQIDIAEGARVDHVRLQNHGKNHVSTNRMIAKLKNDATFSHYAFDIGGSLTRNDIVASIEGEDASVELHGLYLASGEQHIDNHTRVEHRVGPASSHEAYRGILSGRSRCVFNGQAIVFAGADGTDANQENHNLLLSDFAEIDTKPELEIYADDVKCSHGATVGQLDEAAIFYLRSRGLDLAESRTLLTRAFAADVLANVSVEEAHAYIQQAIDQSLNQILDGEAE